MTSSRPRRPRIAIALAVSVVAAILALGADPGAAGTGSAAPESSDASTSTYTPISALSRIANGYTHSCGIDDGGLLYCWGSNGNGQLGTGETSTNLTPIAVATAGTPLDGKSIERVAAGWNSTCAVTTDDVMACWGTNDEGQLGNGSNAQMLVPTAVTTAGSALAGANITMISGQYKHYCARTSTGAAACWGMGNVGQLGNGANADKMVPTDVVTAGSALAGTTIRSISVGSFGTCAIGANGDPSCWGSAYAGGLGNGTTAPNQSLPTSPAVAGTPLDGKDVVAISAARYSVCAVATDGTLACWGIGDDGQIGNGGTANVVVPTAVTTAGTPLATGKVVAIDSGWDHHCALSDANVLACWGDGSLHALGNGSTDDALVPKAVAIGGTVLDGVTLKDVSAGIFSSCAVGTTKQPACWGYGSAGGSGSSSNQAVPVPVAISATVPTTSSSSVVATAAGDTEIDVAWNGLADTGGSAITSVVLRVYANGVLDETATFASEAPDGAGSVELYLDHDTTYRFTVAHINVAGEGPESALSNAITTAPEPISKDLYVPITPCRVLDTRIAGGPLDNREIRDVQVGDGGNDIASQGGNPAGCPIPEGVSAVEASVTAVGPADSGFFRAWPSDESMPNATFMNFDRGMDITNTGAIAISQDDEDDELRIRNFGGRSHYVIDIQGYYGAARAVGSTVTRISEGSVPTGYVAITPCRIVDTRQAGGTLANREIREVQVLGEGGGFAAQGGASGGCGLPEGAVAVEASVTAVGPADSGFFRAWPADASMPNATFMNFDRGMDITNTGALTLDPDDDTDHLKIRNFGGRSHYVIDIQGYFVPVKVAIEANAAKAAAPDPALFVAITPCRIVDTRQAGGTLANREIREVQVLGEGGGFAAQGGASGGCGLPEGAVAVEASVTAVGPADSGFFRAWPADASMPNATFMNFDRGMDITNTGSLTLDPDHETDHLKIRNFGGRSHYVIDIQGYWLAIDLGQ